MRRDEITSVHFKRSTPSELTPIAPRWESQSQEVLPGTAALIALAQIFSIGGGEAHSEYADLHLDSCIP